jgi:hypothetical protein
VNKVNKVVRSILAAALCVAIVPFQVGCNSSTVSQVLSQVSLQIPVALNLTQSILTATGSGGCSFCGTVGAVAQTDLPLLQKYIADYQASSSAGTMQQIYGVVDDMVNTINVQVLAANKVASSESEKLSLVALNSLATVLTIIDSLLITTQSKAQQQAHVAAHAIKASSLMPYLDRQRLDAAARSAGTTTEDIYQREVALGF